MDTPLLEFPVVDVDGALVGWVVGAEVGAEVGALVGFAVGAEVGMYAEKYVLVLVRQGGRWRMKARRKDKRDK